MNIFEITIQRRSESRYPVVAEQISAGELLAIRTEGTLKLEEADFRKLRSLQIRPQDYGTHLGRALFCDRVRDAFVRALGESPDGLRVLLFVEAEDGDIKTLHWHKLCAPIGGEWELLALSQRAPFSLYLPSISDRHFPPIGRRDLKALILVASPRDLGKYNLAEFDVGETVFGVRTALGDIPSEVLASVPDSIGAPTLDDLCRQLTEKQYTLLHVVCHGKLSRDGDTVLYWTQQDNQIRPVPATALLKRLKTLRGTGRLPYFTFLSACESAMPEAEAALGGLAQRLVRELGMPAVVAMTERVSIATASALACEFYQRLRDGGELDRALVEATAASGDRYDILVPALFTRLRGQPLFSESLDRPLTPAEIQFGLSQFGELLADRAPVLKPQFEAREATLARSLPAEAETLARSALIERQTALEAINNLCDEVLEMSFNALALGTPPPAYDPRCPFRGLYPFTVEDREFFFGREGEVKRLRNRLAEHPFLAIVGKSGCGKSSLVLAGLIPELQAERADLQVADFKPGNDPIAQLTASLAKVNNRPHIIVVDQFEELFTLCEDELKRVRFIDKLLKLAAGQTVIVTVRDDFLGECAVYPELRECVERQVLVAPMNLDELRQAMEKQAARVGLRFEGGLTQTLLDDVRDEPGAMPLLQHALWELWKRRHGRWLLSREYREMGKVQEAIARTADEFYRKLSPEKQEQVRNIFIRLTRLDEEVTANPKRRDTRRRVRIQELVPTHGDLAETKALIKQLADARLVVTDVDPATHQIGVEVTHEALIRHWPKLRDWLDRDLANIRLLETIRKAANDWETANYNESYLVHRGSRLEEAEILSQRPKPILNQLELNYVGACVIRRDRDRQIERQAKRRLKYIIGFVSTALIYTTSLLAYPQYLRWRAIQMSPMVSLDEGKAIIGTNDRDLKKWERPQWYPHLSAFYLDQFEVSNEMYRLCVSAKVCSPPIDPQNFNDDTLSNHPVVHVTAHQAAIYCKWLDKRLPTELEWERAARGTYQQNRQWPWGSEPPSDHANLGSRKSTVAIDSYPQGNNYNLIGNVFEYTSSEWQKDYKSYDQSLVWDLSHALPEALALRGGSWASPIDRITYRTSVITTDSFEDVGIRCAKSKRN
ncbi:MAG: SUMF1/EgtB/PvdO family nonheme iron enzyme [Limnospira sp.]